MTVKSGQLLVDEIVPRIAAVVARSVKMVGCEDVQEVTQDAIAMAARMLDSVEKAGKKVTPGNIAYYCLQHIKSGRRSVGNSVVDVLATGTQLHGKCVVESLNEIDPYDHGDDDGGNFSLAEMVSRDTEDPATIGARELDWEKFMESQDECGKTLVMCAAEGHHMSDVAKQCGVSPHVVQQRRNRLASDLREFFGDNILAELARAPRWMNSLMAARERHAAC